jgi:hypothetical protein
MNTLIKTKLIFWRTGVWLSGIPLKIYHFYSTKLIYYTLIFKLYIYILLLDLIVTLCLSLFPIHSRFCYHFSLPLIIYIHIFCHCFLFFPYVILLTAISASIFLNLWYKTFSLRIYVLSFTFNMWISSSSCSSSLHMGQIYCSLFSLPLFRKG